MLRTYSQMFGTLILTPEGCPLLCREPQAQLWQCSSGLLVRRHLIYHALDKVICQMLPITRIQLHRHRNVKACPTVCRLHPCPCRSLMAWERLTLTNLAILILLIQSKHIPQ